MEYDNLFRIIMLVGIALVVPFAFYYRLKSNETHEKLDRKQEGLAILIGIRFFAFLAFAGLFAYFVNPEYMRWSAIELPLWVRAVGVLCGLAGGILWIASFHYLGRNLTDTVIVREKATLVTNGPYKYMRHPFYVAMALVILANGLVSVNWFITLAGLATLAFIYLRIPKEEKRLIERFGDDYLHYMEVTPRFGMGKRSQKGK